METVFSPPPDEPACEALLLPLPPHADNNMINVIKPAATDTIDFFTVYYLLVLFNDPQCGNHPLIAPIIMPLTKYFCKNGYTTSNGTAETTNVAHFMASVLNCMFDKLSVHP